ncbi:MAG: PIN domain-containing protein [Candidatus Thermoplasmatota archaeon]
MLFDSWAWWEVVHSTRPGENLSTRYLEEKGVRVLTVDYTLAEVAAKLARLGAEQRIPDVLGKVEWASDILPISSEIAGLAAALLRELRRTDPNASLADAVVLAAARLNGAVLISGDRCYEGQRDVRAS